VKKSQAVAAWRWLVTGMGGYSVSIISGAG
jgi:hypothetical protein